MPRLNNLAHSQPEHAIIALTGDCTADTHKQLPTLWNQWPQTTKLAVPGNHDLDNTFGLIDAWIYCTSWVTRVNGLVFVSLDTSTNFLLVQYQLDRIRSRAAGGDAVVILYHRWPTANETWVGDRWREFAAGRTLLVLHGHEHPRQFSGSLWEPRARLGTLTCYRSKVYSSTNGRRGLSHVITWENQQFTYAAVQGDLHVGAQPNKLLDASGGSVFLKEDCAAKGV